MKVNYDYQQLYDLIYETITDLEYVHNLKLNDALILTDKIVLVYKRDVMVLIDKFGRDLQVHIQLIDTNIKVLLEEYDDRYQFIIQRKF